MFTDSIFKLGLYKVRRVEASQKLDTRNHVTRMGYLLGATASISYSDFEL